MIDIIRALFYSMPEVGDEYVFDEDNPFVDWVVQVTETKNGWVKYKHQNGFMSSLSRGSFHYCYRRK